MEWVDDQVLPPEQVVHIDHHELVSHPQRALDRTLDHFDLPRFAVDATPPVEAGRHHYGLTGVTSADIDVAFADYRARFLA